MRILLATAVAIAPLLAATGATAEVVVSSSRTSAIRTSNAGTGGVADDVRISNGGTINVTSGTLVTVDSNNNFTLDAGGSIRADSSADGTVGVEILGGTTANIALNGSIHLSDNVADDANVDTDKDGDGDGPFATGSGRYGVRLTGAGALTGDITQGTTGSIIVEGNNSYGIALETDLIGKLQTLGNTRITGDNSYGIRTLGNITGNVYLGGSVVARGGNTRGVSIEGDVDGRLTIQSAISSTGYRYSTRPTETVIAKLDADDLLQGGPAVTIASNIAGGVLLDVRPTETDANNTDEDNDGILDASESDATIVSYGSGPAILIGSDTQSITLGMVGTDDEAYGFINRGTVTSQGVYEGIATQAVVIGTDSGNTVLLEGGFRNEGSIGTLAYQADATAVRMRNGAVADAFFNSGSIAAAAISDAQTQVTGLLIESGASVTTLTNSGELSAISGGSAADVYAILDRSGTLTSITNQGQLTARITADPNGDPVTGEVVAIDVSANTTGVTFIQDGIVDTSSATAIDSDGDGVPDDSEPLLVGDVRFGSGADVFDVRNGVTLGNISFGDGADTLLVSGGAEVRGAITDTDGLLDITVSNGILDARQASITTATSLNVGSQGNLIVTIDPQSGNQTGFNITGTANFANGAGLGARFTSLLDGPERFTIVRAGTLNFGTIDTSSLEENSPYLFIVNAGADTALGEVYIDARRRTAEEAGLIAVESQAYDAIYNALGTNSALLDAFFSQTGRDGFINLYEQMLPDHSGGPLLSLASGVDAVTRALVGRNASAAPGEVSAWVQEINFYADKDRTDTYGFRSEGFGVAGGVERGGDLGAVGLSFAFTSSDLEDPEAEAEEILSASLIELGLYWRAQGQFWTTWARAAGGYATFDSTRRLVGPGLNLSNESNWNGYSLTAAGGASYERNFGRFGVRPEVYAEYFFLNESSHDETGGGDGFDLHIDDRSGHMFTATAAVNFSMAMGQDSWLRPELRVGWRQNISVDPGETTARFLSGGSDFVLTPDTIEGGGPILGFRLNVGNELGMLSVSADAEMIKNYVRYMLFLRASFRF